jgi:hypothetical protein
MKRFLAITSMLALSTGMLMAQDGATTPQNLPD